jgi:hypothetical protein
MHEHVDYTQSFAIQKLLAVVSNTNKGNDVRKQITIFFCHTDQFLMNVLLH